MFGFQYTMGHADIDWDPNEQISLRYRVYTRAIKIKGVAQIGTLYPYLQESLNQTMARQLESQTVSDAGLPTVEPLVQKA